MSHLKLVSSSDTPKREGDRTSAPSANKSLKLIYSTAVAAKGCQTFIFDADTKQTREQWHNNGQLDREDGPAVFIRDAAGRVLLEEWRSDGRLHRNGQPALSKYDAETGIMLNEQWWKAGYLDRVDGPASRVRDRTGSVVSEEWWINDKRHREKGPALIECDPATGIIVIELVQRRRAQPRRWSKLSASGCAKRYYHFRRMVRRRDTAQPGRPGPDPARCDDGDRNQGGMATTG